MRDAVDMPAKVGRHIPAMEEVLEFSPNAAV